MEDGNMGVWFIAVNGLLKRGTVADVQNALEQFNDMLRLCRSDKLRLCRNDKLGARDIVPHLLLWLGRDQEWYDFLKWWATIDDKDHYNGRDDRNDATLPYLDIHGADPFEPIDMFL